MVQDQKAKTKLKLSIDLGDDRLVITTTIDQMVTWIRRRGE